MSSGRTGTVCGTSCWRSYSFEAVKQVFKSSKFSDFLRQLPTAVVPEDLPEWQYGPAQTCINKSQWTLLDHFLSSLATDLPPQLDSINTGQAPQSGRGLCQRPTWLVAADASPRGQPAGIV